MRGLAESFNRSSKKSKREEIEDLWNEVHSLRKTLLRYESRLTHLEENLDSGIEINNQGSYRAEDEETPCSIRSLAKVLREWIEKNDNSLFTVEHEDIIEYAREYSTIDSSIISKDGSIISKDSSIIGKVVSDLELELGSTAVVINTYDRILVLPRTLYEGRMTIDRKGKLRKNTTR